MSPEELEERIGHVLEIGTTISTVVLAVGLVLWFILGPATIVQVILSVGIFVLIATPIGRVVASTVGFAIQRDWQMVLMTTLVLLSLAMSVVVAMRK